MRSCTTTRAARRSWSSASCSLCSRSTFRSASALRLPVSRSHRRTERVTPVSVLAHDMGGLNRVPVIEFSARSTLGLDMLGVAAPRLDRLLRLESLERHLIALWRREILDGDEPRMLAHEIMHARAGGRVRIQIRVGPHPRTEHDDDLR